MFCIYLRTNSDLCHLQHKLIGFYNRDEKCLQRGTGWVFKKSNLRFVFKEVNEAPFNLSTFTEDIKNLQTYLDLQLRMEVRN